MVPLAQVRRLPECWIVKDDSNSAFAPFAKPYGEQTRARTALPRMVHTVRSGDSGIP